MNDKRQVWEERRVVAKKLLKEVEQVMRGTDPFNRSKDVYNAIHKLGDAYSTYEWLFWEYDTLIEQQRIKIEQMELQILAKEE